MIASVSGEVLEIRPDALVVSLGGFGVLVLCAPATVAGAKPPCTISTTRGDFCTSVAGSARSRKNRPVTWPLIAGTVEIWVTKRSVVTGAALFWLMGDLARLILTMKGISKLY